MLKRYGCFAYFTSIDIRLTITCHVFICSKASMDSSSNSKKPATLDAAPPPPPVPLEMIERIQNAWRGSFRVWTTPRRVRNFVDMVTSERVMSISFDELVSLLREKPVITAAKKCLQRIHLLSTFRHGSTPTGGLAPENVNVRVFLAAYMISFRPTHVFESLGTSQQAVIDAAKLLIASFEQICSSVIPKGDSQNVPGFHNVPLAFTEQFQTLLFEYMKRFKAWKVPDEEKLSCRIKHALVALFEARGHLPPDEPADGRLMVEFNTQIERLKSKLVQIAGQAALTEFMMTATIVHAHGDGNHHGSAYAELPSAVTNEALAHELLCDPAFRLDDSGGSGLENPVVHRIRTSFHQAFWDSLVSDLSLAVPCYTRIVRVLVEIRDGISVLAGPQEAIADVIDIDFLRQQSEAGALGWEICARIIVAVVDVIRRTQVPAREAETASKWADVQSSMLEAEAHVGRQPRTFCGALEFLIDRINAMRIDAANARLRLIAPVIKDHGVDYERGKFQDKLTAGTLTLERTSSWIRGFVDPHLEQLLTGSAPAFMAVHSDAMLSLSTSETVSCDCVPETLLFDVHRLADFRSKFRSIVDAASLIITVTHAVKPGAIAGAVADLFASDVDVPPSAASVFDLAKRMSTAPLPRSLEQALVNVVKPDDAVNKLVVYRVTKLLRSIVSSGGGAVVPLDFIACAQKLIPRIEALGRRIYALASINRIVHTPTYNRLIEEAVADHRARSALAA